MNVRTARIGRNRSPLPARGGLDWQFARRSSSRPVAGNAVIPGMASAADSELCAGRRVRWIRPWSAALSSRIEAVSYLLTQGVRPVIFPLVFVALLRPIQTVGSGLSPVDRRSRRRPTSGWYMYLQHTLPARFPSPRPLRRGSGCVRAERRGFPGLGSGRWSIGSPGLLTTSLFSGACSGRLVKARIYRYSRRGGGIRSSSRSGGLLTHQGHKLYFAISNLSNVALSRHENGPIDALFLPISARTRVNRSNPGGFGRASKHRRALPRKSGLGVIRPSRVLASLK